MKQLLSRKPDAHWSMCYRHLKRIWKLHWLPQPREALGDAAAKWLMGLPEHVRPLELMKRFPRIANKLYELWDSQTSFHFLAAGTTVRVACQR